ncbi:MAG: hypothetical protein ACJAVK_003547 [Akkermansiaceae bacterium]|jgi:hypothetical protein
MPSIQDLLQEIALLSSTSATLDWDQETYAPAQSVGLPAVNRCAYSPIRVEADEATYEIVDGSVSNYEDPPITPYDPLDPFSTPPNGKKEADPEEK